MKYSLIRRLHAARRYCIRFGLSSVSLSASTWTTISTNGSLPACVLQWPVPQQTNSVDGSGAIYNALNQLPEVPARNPDGSFGMQTENMYGTYFSNPLSDLIQNENYSRSTQVYVNAFADIKLWKGLVFRTEYAANYNYNTGYRFTPSYDYEFFKQQSSASRSSR